MSDELRGAHKHLKRMPIDQIKEFNTNKRRWGLECALSFEECYRNGVYFRGFSEEGMSSDYQIVAYFELFEVRDVRLQRAVIQKFCRDFFKIPKADVFRDQSVGHLVYCRFKDVR